jgi:hypothetical protein
VCPFQGFYCTDCTVYWFFAGPGNNVLVLWKDTILLVEPHEGSITVLWEVTFIHTEAARFGWLFLEICSVGCKIQIYNLNPFSFSMRADNSDCFDNQDTGTTKFFTHFLILTIYSLSCSTVWFSKGALEVIFTKQAIIFVSIWQLVKVMEAAITEACSYSNK